MIIFPYLRLEEQTKLIAQGIEKGIALYKKQQKERARQADKAKKKVQKNKLQSQQHESLPQPEQEHDSGKTSMLPWLLLIISWIGFIVYVTQK